MTSSPKLLAVALLIVGVACSPALAPSPGTTGPKQLPALRDGYKRVFGPGASFGIPSSWHAETLPATSEPRNIIECTDDAYHVVRLYTMAYQRSTADLFLEFERGKEKRLGADAVELSSGHRTIGGEDAIVVMFDHHDKKVDTRDWYVLLAVHGQAYHLLCSVRDDVKDTSTNACPTILATIHFD